MTNTQPSSSRAQKLRFIYTKVGWSPKLSALLQRVISVLDQMLTEKHKREKKKVPGEENMFVSLPLLDAVSALPQCPWMPFTVFFCASAPVRIFLSVTPIWLLSSQNCP